MSPTLPPKIEVLEKQVIRNAPIGILACDPNGVVRISNSKAVQLLAGEQTSASETKDFNQQAVADLLPQLDLNQQPEQPQTLDSSWGQTVHVQTVKFDTDEAVWAILYVSEKDSYRERAMLLEKEASTDELSGLSNRRAFQRKLEGNTHRALSLAIIDVDHFKNINDLKGHPIGDEVIRVVGKVLHQSFSESAILVARMGGDEFSVLFETLDSSNTIVDSLESFRNQLVKTSIPDAEDLRVTVSIGAAISVRAGTGTRTLLTQADEELYKAKAAGRNQVAWIVLGGEA